MVPCAIAFYWSLGDCPPVTFSSTPCAGFQKMRKIRDSVQRIGSMDREDVLVSLEKIDIGFVIYPNFNALDLVGPYEVLSRLHSKCLLNIRESRHGSFREGNHCQNGCRLFGLPFRRYCCCDRRTRTIGYDEPFGIDDFHQCARFGPNPVFERDWPYALSLRPVVF